MPYNHALVFGASGISGIPLLRNLLRDGSFSHITGLTFRPLSLSSDAQKVFEINTSSSKLQLVSGLDLGKPTGEVTEFLQTKVKGIDTVTHVFFVAYTEIASDLEEQARVNIAFIRHAIAALNILAAESLKFVVLQTGGKHYGVEYQDEIQLKAPLKEETPRMPEPYAKKIFYYGQVDVLKELSAGKKWTWAEVRPDAIIGIVPRGNFMNLAVGLAIYLSFKSVLEPGSTVPFPATIEAFNTTHTDTDHDILARLEIHLATKATENEDGRKRLSEKAFNTTNGDVVTWAAKWSPLCAYFGLKGVPPLTLPQPPEGLQEYVKKHKAEYLEKVGDKAPKAKENIDEAGSALVFAGLVLSFGKQNREYDIRNIRELAEFTESIDTVKSFTNQFDKMKALGFIP